MKKTLLDGNAASAWGARLARVQVVPAFPVTPQTEIIETIAQWKADGEFPGEFVQLESEHSVMSAAVASEATGARTFTGSSSQGLMLMHEIIYVASGMRLPIVMVNVSRALSAPITLWPDHNDILDQRDSGWLTIFCETNQEILDTIIMMYRVCEDPRVMLPAFVNMEGFYLSYTREPVTIPEQGLVDKFLPSYQPKIFLDPKKPMAEGIGVMTEYTYFREQAHLAQKNALKVVEEVQAEWEKMFGRKYEIVESFMMDEADAAFVVMGSSTTIARAAVRKMRKAGKKIGLIRIRLFRPFPKDEIARLLSGVKAVGVLDQNLAPGAGGILFSEIKSAIYGSNVPVSDLIFSLGGKPVSAEEFEKFGDFVLDSANTKKTDVFFQD
jgi:pyruvate ferredoxin oxidoreductase alpha subunit